MSYVFVKPGMTPREIVKKSERAPWGGFCLGRDERCRAV